MRLHKFYSILKRNKSIVLLVFIVIIASLTSTKFATWKNLTNILQQIAPTGIAATGLTMVFITGGFDMSIGSVMSLTGVITMMQLEAGCMLSIAILSGLLVGAATGLLNGILIAYVKINPFIATLATQTLVRGCALGMTDTYPITLWHETFAKLSLGSAGVVPYAFITVLLLAGLFELYLKMTRSGHNIYICGSNKELGFSQGINMNYTQVFCYTLCGLTASVAGLFLASKLGSGSPVVAEDSTLLAMIAIIIGGNSLKSSKASLGKTLVGIFILGILNNMMNLMGTMSYFQTIIKGAIIILVIAVDADGVQMLVSKLKRVRAI